MAEIYASSSASGGGAGTYADPYTLQEGLDAVTAGNTLRVLNDGTYTPSARLDFDANVGTATDPIRIIGWASDDSGEARAVISGSSLPATTDLFSLACSGYPYLIVKNVRFTAATRDNFVASNSTQRYIKLVDCRFDNAARYGVNGTYFWNLLRCEIDNNTSYGANGVAQGKFVLCSLHHNQFGSVSTGQYSVFVSCLIYENSAGGLIVNDADSIYVNCIFSDNSSYGLSSGVRAVIVNCIFAYNGTYGIQGTLNEFSIVENNCFYSNTSDAVATGIYQGNGIVTGDPAFVSHADGSENYALGSGSSCLAAGTPGVIPGEADSNPMTGYMDIGAIQAQVAAGGGGIGRRPRGFLVGA